MTLQVGDLPVDEIFLDSDSKKVYSVYVGNEWVWSPSQTITFTVDEFLGGIDSWGYSSTAGSSVISDPNFYSGEAFRWVGVDENSEFSILPDYVDYPPDPFVGAVRKFRATFVDIGEDREMVWIGGRDRYLATWSGALSWMQANVGATATIKLDYFVDRIYA